MKYRIRHVTEYEYDEAVPLCQNVARLHPRDTHRQRCLSHELLVSPVPALRRDRIDFFGNPISCFSLQEPHSALSVAALSEVELGPADDPGTCAAVPWEAAVAALASAEEPHARAARPFVFESPHVRHEAALAEYARPSFTPGRPLVESVLDLTRRIHAEFKFVAGATTVGTPVLDVLASREGVCQDFAHLEIGCLRSLGLAARYVSGYVRTKPAPGKERLVGVDASHAWLGMFLPGYGWLDFDPTHGAMPADAHITAAWARDYTDVAPLKGVLIGGRGQSLKVSVEVEPLPE